jgi:hypothetical protein
VQGDPSRSPVCRASHGDEAAIDVGVDVGDVHINEQIAGPLVLASRLLAVGPDPAALALSDFARLFGLGGVDEGVSLERHPVGRVAICCVDANTPSMGSIACPAPTAPKAHAADASDTV